MTVEQSHVPATTPGRLTIRTIEAIVLRAPLARPYNRRRSRVTHRSALIARVTTEDGLVGEGYVVDEDAEVMEVEGIMREEIGPRLVGEDGFAVERLWERARPATFDIIRSRHLGLVATGCVDMAIWDLVGKALEQPLWRLWGGYGNRVSVIATGAGLYSPDADLESEVRELQERGLAGMKLKVGGLSPEGDAERFRLARKAAGSDFVLAVDANQGWTAREAIRFAHLVEDDDLLWFEEPCRWHNDRRAMRDVRLAGNCRVCAGQGELSAAGCLDLMVEGAIDICNFDASWGGGATEWRRVAAMAQSLDVAMGHHVAPQVASHLLASVPHGTYAEVSHPDRDPIWWNLVSNRPPLRDGQMALSDAPGLGWELDGDFIERYRMAVPSDT